MADPDIEEQLEDKTKQIGTPVGEIFRTTYRRRGSDLIFAATMDNRVQVTRYNHRFGASKHYVHDADFLERNRDAIKAMLEKGGYKLHERKDLTKTT